MSSQTGGVWMVLAEIFICLKNTGDVLFLTL